MKIDCSKLITSLDGTPIKVGEEHLTLGFVIAEAMASDKTGGKMKLYILAEKAYKNQVMEVDAADHAFIKKAVEQCTSYNQNAIILGQALAYLEGESAS